jgi:hypothetical protein
MQRKRIRRLCCLTAGIISGCLLISFYAYGALLYKTYLVRQVSGIDILCDPYVVQKNDWILKVFRQKGEISHRDFPEFLSIFKRINPHINNMDIIRPGQHILIPLKKLLPGAMPGQASGVITIPFVTMMSVSELLAKHTIEYKVKKGDCVSKLITRRFGVYGSQSYKEGLKLFKKVNPDISDINRIIAGQTIKIPKASVQNESWYFSIFDNSNEFIADSGIKPKSDIIDLSAFEFKESNEESKSPLAEVASILDAKFINKGIYHFPRKNKKDVELNLSRFPMFEFNDGQRVICTGEKGFSESQKEIIRSHWKNLKFAAVPAEATSEQVFDAVLKVVKKNNSKTVFSFSDQGVKVIIRAQWIIDKPSGPSQVPGQGTNRVCIFWIDSIEEKIPDSILRYLLQHNIIVKELFRANKEIEPPPEGRLSEYGKNIITLSVADHKSFVSDLLAALDYKYIPNVHITFPYAGVQVKTISNFISTDSGHPLLVDYGDFYGDSVDAIKKSGFDIVQIFKNDPIDAVAEKILKAVGIAYKKNPMFHAAQKPGPHNIDLIISGFLINNEADEKIFLAGHPLDNQIAQFLKGKKIKLIIGE